MRGGFSQDYVFYIGSTCGFVAMMLASALLWRSVTPLLEKPAYVIACACIAGVATVLLRSGVVLAAPAAIALAALTGMATSQLCLKAGGLCSSFTLSESMFSCFLSLVLAATLYFCGLGLPREFSGAYLGLLPLFSALLLVIPQGDPYPAQVDEAQIKVPFLSKGRRLLDKMTCALAIIGLTSGIAKGIMSNYADQSMFGWLSAVVVIVMAVLAAAVLVLQVRYGGAHGLHMVYTLLMVLGIGEMLASCFGFPLSMIGSGQQLLWALFFCLISYHVFKLNASFARAFGFTMAVYYAFSLAGWFIGGELTPSYNADATVRMVTGIAMAFAVMMVLLFILTEVDIHNLVTSSFAGAVSGEVAEEREQGEADGLAGSPDVARTSADSARVDADAGSLEDGEESTLASAPAHDPLARAKEPLYGVSSRELEILALFAQGRSANWIAEYLVISKNTVRTHLRNVYGKLDVHSRQELLDFLDYK